MRQEDLAYDLTKFSVYRLRVKATGEELTGYVHADRGVFFGSAWHPAQDFTIERRVHFTELMEFFGHYEDWPRPILEGMTCTFPESRPQSQSVCSPSSSS